MNKFLRHISAHFLLGMFLQTAHAADLSDHPGYLDFDELSFIDGRQPSVEVTLNGPVLKMLLQLPIEYDESGEAEEWLKVVEQVLVRVYTLTPDQADDTLEFINETSESLEDKDWVRIVRVRDDEDESVDIHVKMSADGENLNGLVIMAFDSSADADDGDDNGEAEVVIVNIAGNFNPAYLANIGEQFDIDELDGVEVP